jgi:N,N'-diacetylchitobiose phosphorylase
MNFGYFDDKNKEYVVTDPETPAPWTNYLGEPAYGALITNNAGGFSFVKSGGEGRINRYLFNGPIDGPGRYFYLFDQQKKVYWTASWAPVCKDKNLTKYVCRHGTSYSVISSEYDKIKTEATYFVPIGALHDVWIFNIENTDSVEREISVFPFVEFTNDNNELQDGVNLQYTRYIARTYYKGNLMVEAINENMSELGATFSSQGSSDAGGPGIYRFLALIGADADGFDGDRDTFLGYNHGYHNPKSIQAGRCQNSLSYGANSVGVMQINLKLAPSEKKKIAILLGPGGEEIARDLQKKYSDISMLWTLFTELKSFWHNRLKGLEINTPDENFNRFVNIWNAYQCFITFTWSRSASLEYRGLRNGLGYRDTVQDIQGIIHLDHKTARTRLEFMLSGQGSSGGGLPLVRFDHVPGTESLPGTESYLKRCGHSEYRCDDHLWLFRTVPHYVKESGDFLFYDKVIPYADKDEDTVYGHLKRALEFSINHLGKRGLVLGLDADWCDGLRLGKGGETLFASHQFYLGLKVFAEIAQLKGNKKDEEWADGLANTLYENIQKYAWEDDRFVRAFTKDDLTIGSKQRDEGSLWLNPQSWAVISGVARKEQGEIAMDTVYKNLNTKYGIMLLYPAFRKFGLPVARMILNNPGMKENAAVFSHTQGWAILAETMLGNGNRAMEYYLEACPGSMNDQAEIRCNEPYVHGQFTHAIDSPYYGKSQCHWLSGTASTMQVAAVEGILGIQPQYNGITIDPCIPSTWTELSFRRVFRGKVLETKVSNPNRNQKGVKKLILNGEILSGNFIPVEKLKESNQIEIEI